jgi:pilus assembly protein CpaB
MKMARLVVLGIAGVAGVGAALLAGRSPEAPAPAPAVRPPPIESIEILVAAKDINIGQTVQPADVTWLAWPVGSVSPLFVQRNEHPDGVEQVSGAIVRVPIASGEPLRENKLIKAKGSGYMAAILPGGMRAISTEISPETGAGGFILPNDRVDVILSRRDKEAERLTGIESMVAETLGD